MKRTTTKLISLLLATMMCFSLLPAEVFAWGKMTHVYTANLIEDETSDGSTSVKNYDYAVPEEFLEAIEAYPDAFRAGALGPDMYPDILTGQMYIHPKDEKIDSGEWVTYLCDAVNKMGKGTEGRKIALAFTLGCMLHYCGDLFGHDFVNTFTGGAFPSVASLEMLDLTGERLNNVLSHLSVEKYMDTLLYPTYNPRTDGEIDAPDQFVRDAMIFDGTPGAGLVPLYEKYPETINELLEDVREELEYAKDLIGWVPAVWGAAEYIIDEFLDGDGNNVPPHYTAFLALREYVVSTADEYRENMEPVSAAITRYCDEWAEDIDKGINAFTAASDNIASRLVTKEKNPEIEKKKEEDREKEQNLFLDLSDYNIESMILEYYPENQVDWVKRDLEEAGLYGESFFDLILMELILKGVVTIDMVKTNDGSISIIKEELSFWMDEYGVYMLGIPDIIIDGIEIPVIGDIIEMALLKPIWSWIGGAIKNWAAEEIVSACTGLVSFATGLPADEVAGEIRGFVSKIDDRLEDPKVQLDHPDNPYKPSENNFAELEKYMNSLPAEKQEFTMDSDLEALYNTLTMFQLVLMGPENYSDFISTYAYGAKQNAYQMGTGHLEASALTVRIKTSDLYLSGTNDNIYVIVYRKLNSSTHIPLTIKLLDKSGYDDFEAGHQDDYLVELPESVKLDEIEIALRKTPAFDFIPSMTDDWHCENIRVIPMYAGYDLTAPIDLGGVKLKGICNVVRMDFQGALEAKDPDDVKTQTVTNLEVQVKVRDKLYAGSDSDIYVVAYYGDVQWAKVCLDKAVYNDLERGDNDIYYIPITYRSSTIKGIPLNELRIKIDHTGSDEANWESVWITPCYGSLKLTDPIAVGGKTFEDSKWDTNFQSKLKNATYRDGQKPDMSQNVTALNVQVRVSAELYAGTDDDIYLCAYWGKRKDPVKRVLLDKSWYNDFEMGDCDNYLIILSASESEGIPLDKLRIEFEHDGDDESYWAEVKVTPISSTTALTDPISVGGQKFENSTWDTDFQNCLKMQCAPLEIEYETNLDDGLLSYMGSLDGGEEWVDNANELWANTTLRREIFFKLFKGFAPEITYVRYNLAPEDNTFDLGFDFTGVWNGVSNERRSQVKDLEHVYPVEGSADVEVIDINGKVVKALNGMSVEDGSVRFMLKTDGWEEGYYDLKVSYSPDHANPLYSSTVETFEKAIRVGSLQASITPESVTAEPGQKTTLTVNASGGKVPYTYNWMVRHSSGKAWVILDDSSNYQDIAKYQGQGTNTLTCTIISAGSKEVICAVADANGMKVNAQAMIFAEEAAAPLSIKTQPKDVTVEPSRRTTLTVEATGGQAPYTYTWQIPTPSGRGVEWKAIPNSTISGYTGQGTNVLAFSSGNVGTTRVRCVVEDAKGNTVTSDAVTITVQETTAPLAITTQPESVTVEAGKTATFTVAASGGKAPYTYTWQMPSGTNWVDVPNGSGYSGQGTDTFNFDTESPVYTRVRCVVSDANGNTVTSDAAEITVEAAAIPLSITTQPKDTTVEAGETATFTVEASGGQAPYTYTWQMPSGKNWVDVPNGSGYSGQGTDTFNFDTESPVYTRVRCVVSDANGNTVTSDAAEITVEATVEPLIITTQPMDTTFEAGGNSGVYVEVSGGQAPYTYTWQTQIGRSWIPFQDTAEFFGQGTNVLICAVTTAGTSTVRCVISDESGQEVISDAAVVTVEAAPLTVEVQPGDVTVEAGETVYFTVEVSGGQAPYKYSWQGLKGKTWLGIRESAMHKGQGTNTFSCTPNDVGISKYHCVVTDSAGNSVTTETVSVTVKPLAVQINNGETEITFYHTESETLTANVTGGVGPYTYTWYRKDYNWSAKAYEWEKVSTSSSYEADGFPREDYPVKVEVKDSAGTTVTAEIVVRLTGIVN